MGCLRKWGRPVPFRYGPSPSPTTRRCRTARRPSGRRYGLAAANRSLPRILGLYCPCEIPVRSNLFDPPFSVVALQYPQHASRVFVRLDGRAVLGPVAKLHRHLCRIDHLRIGRAYGDNVVPERWRPYTLALTVIIDQVERRL